MSVLAGRKLLNRAIIHYLVYSYSSPSFEFRKKWEKLRGPCEDTLKFSWILQSMIQNYLMMKKLFSDKSNFKTDVKFLRMSNILQTDYFVCFGN